MVTPSPVKPLRGPFGVGLQQVRFVDHSRMVSGTHTSSGRPGPRVLATDVWYPSSGIPSTATQPVPDATPATSEGPFPLVVFGPGFGLGPSSYAPLLASLARAGYVVAAPAFPLGKPGAIGGLDESDIVNQPADISFIITQLTRPGGDFAGVVDRSNIAVAGHSDGGDAALAASDASCCRDPRIDALIVMAGAEMPSGVGYFSRPGPPILVIQAAGDTVNPPPTAHVIYANAASPKYLLWFRAGDHLSPYTGTAPLEAVVRTVTRAFLNRYIGGMPEAPIRLPTDASTVAELHTSS